MQIKPKTIRTKSENREFMKAKRLMGTFNNVNIYLLPIGKVWCQIKRREYVGNSLLEMIKFVSSKPQEGVRSVRG